MHPIKPINPSPQALRYGWWGFCLMLGLIFLLRGQAVLQLYPAMEGFDEFQHTAYLIHLAEQRTLPVLGETRVPLSLYPEIANNPHSDMSMGQAGLVGALKYRHFYTHHPTTNTQVEILLFQAQHPPVYYLASWRLFNHIRTNYGYREAVYTLRSVQLLFGAAALVLMLSTLSILIRDPGVARLAALAISLVPMNLIYILRVSNDALAVLFASLVFFMLAHIRDDRHLVVKTIVISLLLAAGAMTKTIAFLFLPVVLAFLFFLLFDRSFSRIRVLASLFLVPLIYIVCCHRYHLTNKEKFGTMFPALETILNAEKHHDLAALLGAIKPSDLWTFFLDRLIKNNVWKSGMTFLEPHPAWEWLIASVMFIGVVGWIVRLKSREGWRELGRPSPGRYLLLCLLSVGATFAGAYVHGLNCRLAWGQLITPAYYVMVAFPALLAMVCYGLLGFPKKMAAFLIASLAVLYIGAEFDSLLRVALPYWTNSREPGLIFERIRMLGSSWNDPLLAIMWWTVAAVGLGFIVQSTVRALRESNQGGHDRT